MDAANPVMSTIACLGIIAVVPFLHLLRTSFSPVRRPQWNRLAAVCVAGAVVSAVTVLSGVTRIPQPLWSPAIALGALFAAASVSAIIPRAISTVRLVVFVIVCTLVIFVPVSSIVFGSWFDPFATGLGILDIGGAIPVFLAGGAAALGSGLIERLRSSAEGVLAPRMARVALPALGLWVAWIAWLLGSELAIDSISPIILVNTLVMPVIAALAGALVERLRHGTNTTMGLGFGFVAGLVAAASASAYLTLPLAIMLALLCGAVVAAVRRTAATPLIALVIPALTTAVLLGFLATNVSLIYTGQPEVVFTQTLAALIALVLGAAVGAGSWFLLRPSRDGRH